MALTTILEIETHPDGTVGIASIVNGNWERLEEIFDPALASSDSAYQAFWRALVRSATDPVSDNAMIHWDAATSKPQWKEGFASHTFASPFSIDAHGGVIQYMSITSNLNLQSLTDQHAGDRVVFIIENQSGATRNLSFPSGWIFLGTKPTNIADGVVAKLELDCIGTTDATVIADYEI
jgi:hypothetical protein